MLTEEEQAALERVRSDIDWKDLVPARQPEQILNDAQTLVDAMLRLYPDGHDDEITPERLVDCGFVASDDCENEFHIADIRHSVATGWWWVECDGDDELIDHRLHPRNMGEVWQLLERCGIPVKKGGE